MFGILGIEAHDSVRYSESIQNQGDFMKILLSILMISCASTALASMNCETANTKILYYCEGEDLVISRTNEPYRPGIPFNVSVCEDTNNNLVMEVFPFGLFTDHYTDADFERPTVRAAVSNNPSVMGRDIYEPNSRTQNTDYQTVYTVEASDWDKNLFEAKFYDGTKYSHYISGDMICAKQN